MISFERLPGESTAVFLGRTLDDIDLHEMAERARAFHFDDYLCPDDVPNSAMNINRLVAELKQHKLSATAQQKRLIQSVIEAAMDGTFDGTREESDTWGKSEDGQQAFRELMGGNSGRSND